MFVNKAQVIESCKQNYWGGNCFFIGDVLHIEDSHGNVQKFTDSKQLESFASQQSQEPHRQANWWSS